jgi:hypothetical protein
MFNDGSDARMRRPVGEAGQGYFAGHINRAAPGGQSSIVFDDSISRINNVGSDESRHTNGLRRIQQQQQQRPEYAPQPPGGRSSFSLTDASQFDYQPQHRQQQVARGDALDALVRTTSSYAPPASHPVSPGHPAPMVMGGGGGQNDVTDGSHRAQLAPPGGRSTFSVGWGQDQGNHHHAYLARKMPTTVSGHGQGLGHLFGGSGNVAPPRPTYYGDDPARNTDRIGMDRGGFDSVSSSRKSTPSFAAAFTERAPQQPGAISDYAGVHANGRVSTTVLQPPGGRSSFAFG